MSTHRPWSPNELLLAFRLYCHTPFGKLDRHNAEIIELANQLRRTPSAVGMKACNFASLDPEHQKRGVAGLGNVSRADRELWDRFVNDPDTIAQETEAAYEAIQGNRTLELLQVKEPTLPDGPSEIELTIRARRVQRFFRAAVLAAYDMRCALTGLAVPELLNASHIIPWSKDERRRADPCNGLCLNALHDRAFDRGLIGFDERLRVIVSPALRSPKDAPPLHREVLVRMEGRELRSPDRFYADAEALAWHRAHVFRAAG